MRAAFLSCLPLVLLLMAASLADDWPQWLGTNRDSVWREDGIVERFPDEGLRAAWRTPVGIGYAGPAVQGGRVYLMDYIRQTGEIKNNPSAKDTLTGQERILCLDAGTGAVLWTHKYDRPYHFSFAGGPRCTPTVAGNKVYALGAEGNLWCLDAETGRVVWNADFVKDFGAATPLWGVASHPLVDGDLLLCVVGGKGSVAVAFEKDTGRKVWSALSASEQGYCPPTIIEHGGARQLLIWHGDSLNSLNPRTGALYWSLPVKPRFGMAIAAPRKLGSRLFASAYGEAAMLALGDSSPGANILWRAQPADGLFSANCTPLFEGDTIYGCDVETGALMAVRSSDGKRLWQTLVPTSGGQRRDRYATAFLVKHGNRFVLLSETGDLILANLSPEGYEEISRAHLLDPTNQTFGRPVVWSHPAFASRCVYARNDKELVCVSLEKAR